MSFLCKIFGHKFKSFTNADTQEVTSRCIRCGIRKNVLIIGIPKEEMKEEEYMVIGFTLITGKSLTVPYTIERYERYIDLMDLDFPLFFKFSNGIVRKSSIIEVTRE